MIGAIAAVLWAMAAIEQPQASELSNQARELARAGLHGRALELYRQALAIAPDDMAIRRDYAVTLGWADQYPESRRQFRRVLEMAPEQPAWALAEMARTELYGGNPAGALELLDRLIAGGDVSEATLARKGLALRWLGRAAGAETVFRQMLTRYPHSAAARLGVIYSLADRDDLERALQAAQEALAANPSSWEFLKAKGQVLNWLGRHREAQRVFLAIGPEHAGDREVLEGRALAARWGGDPGAARQTAARLLRVFPASRAAAQLNRDLALEYGYSAASSFRLIQDNDGLTDRTWSQELALHAGASHRFHFGSQYRRFSQERDLGWRRHETGWSGVLGGRLTASASMAEVDYVERTSRSRLVADGSLAFALNDRARLAVGAGSMAMDAYRSVENRVGASFYSVNLVLRPQSRSVLEAQYAQYRFSDDVRRGRVDLIFARRVRNGRRARMELGGRSNWLWHDRETPHFFSPTFFQTHLATARVSGRLSPRLEYGGEIGAGLQTEPGLPAESPLMLSGSLLARLSRNFALQAEAGRSTSSLERVNPGRASYSRRFAAVTLQIRWQESPRRTRG